MAWVYLFVAGILEIVWAYAMKQSHGFSRLIPSLVTLGAMIASFGLPYPSMSASTIEKTCSALSLLLDAMIG